MFGRGRQYKGPDPELDSTNVGEEPSADPMHNLGSLQTADPFQKTSVNIFGVNAAVPKHYFANAITQVTDSQIQVFGTIPENAFQVPGQYIEFELSRITGHRFQEADMVLTIRNDSATDYCFDGCWSFIDRATQMPNGTSETDYYHTNHLRFLQQAFAKNHKAGADKDNYYDNTNEGRAFLYKSEPVIFKPVCTKQIDYAGNIRQQFIRESQGCFIPANSQAEVRFDLSAIFPMFKPGIMIPAWLRYYQTNKPRIKFFFRATRGINPVNDYGLTIVGPKSNLEHMEDARAAGLITLRGARIDIKAEYITKHGLRKIVEAQNKYQIFRDLIPQRHEQPLTITTGQTIDQTSQWSSIAGQVSLLMVELRNKNYLEIPGEQNARYEIVDFTFVTPEGKTIDYEKKKAELQLDQTAEHDDTDGNGWFLAQNDRGQYMLEAPFHRGYFNPATGAPSGVDYISPDGKRRRMILINHSRNITSDFLHGTRLGYGIYDNNYFCRLTPGVGYDGQPVVSKDVLLVVTAWRQAYHKIGAGQWVTNRLGGGHR